MQSKFYGPLVNIWAERIRAAQTSKSRFNKIAKTCNAFYESQQGFMFRDKQFFNGELPQPKFSICIAKAYEYVSIIGPSLFWNYAHRQVVSQRQLELFPELFGDPRDQEAQQMGQQIMFQESREQAVNEFRNSLLSIYLNWSQREQPAGLISHGNQAVTESLIKGLGLLWPETYSSPGSDAVYTRLQYGSVDDLLIDPDCTDPLWETAGYIMCRHVNPVWEVERMFGLERGALEGKATRCSAELTARRDAGQADRSKQTFDCLEWYEIWSKVGVGPRTKMLNHHMVDLFDEEVTGDYAYLCIAPGCNFPLNAPPDRFFGAGAATAETVKDMFAWRCRNFGDKFPCYMDGRWPVSKLSYHPLMGSPWPLAPLAPGLGELIAINVLTSSFIDSAWNNRQQILAYLKSAASEVEDILSSDAAVVHVGLNDNIHNSIHECVQFLQKPSVQGDLLGALEMLSVNFNRRVGLNEMQYGESRTQIRIASDSRSKTEALSVRPQKMSGDVGRWLTDASQLEMMLSSMYVQGKDLVHLLGNFGAQQWDQLVTQMPLELLMREAKASVEASEIRRPNKDRDTANIQSLQQYVLPMLQQFAQATGNTQPLNKFMDLVAESMDMQRNPVELPPWGPEPPDEKQQQMQEQMQQAEMRKQAAEAAVKESTAQKNMADIQRIMADAQMQQAEMPMEMRVKEADVMQKHSSAQKNMASAQKTMIDTQAVAASSAMPGGMIGELKHQQELRQDEEAHEQELLHNDQDQVQKLLFANMNNAQEAVKKEAEVEFDEES